MNLDQAGSIFFNGIKGVGMSGLAVFCKQMGKQVGGADSQEHFITDSFLEKQGIAQIQSFEEPLPAHVDMLVYSSAHQGSKNRLVLEASNRGIRVMHQAEFIGSIMPSFTTSVAVCGSHGKSTTSALLAFALRQLHAEPSYFVGVPRFNGMDGSHFGKKDYFVVEADEYGVDVPQDTTPKLLSLHPTHVLVTNIDYDHPDVYKNIEQVKEVFKKFMQNKNIIASADDKELSDILQTFPRSSYQTYGFSDEADLHITSFHSSETEISFELLYQKKPIGSFQIELFGEKNATNTAGVILTLLELGYDADAIRSAIRNFRGAERRFQCIGQVQTMRVFDDYAHHPTEIEAVIEAARERFPTSQLIICFEPHTYSRTFSLKNEFVTALSRADFAFIAPIFPSARENPEMYPISATDLELLAKERGIQNVTALAHREEFIPRVLTLLKPNTVIFTMGAGSIYQISEDIVAMLSTTQEPVLKT
ncbi:UDP-N-acetylmuramate--L-alanine ligase [Candidatus Roizmanbacteria bacterium]|nr:UDP-N-acetylmuramate--L-alanine ligase [Candidatus Roizmanbacteria bacterium]